MKKSILFAGMLFCAVFALNAQTIHGKGDVVKQEIQLETLTGVKLGFHGDIILTQGSSQKIVLEGQQNILDNIKREVKDGTWKVYNKRNVRNAKKITVHITLATIKDVAVSGSGSISATNRFTGLDDLDLAVSGSGDIDLDLQAADVGTHISGSGEIMLAGTAQLLDVHISGSGDVHAGDLHVTNCNIRISGSGNAKVYATGSLEATISGSGDVRYRGDAAKVRSRVSGSGNVRQIN